MKKTFIFIAFYTFSISSFAMECMSVKLEEKFSTADFVFEATVTSRQKLREESNGICWTKGEKCGSKVATVIVGEVWKGQFDSSETSIYSADGCYCLGIYFPVGSKYLVFGRKSTNNNYKVIDMGACWTESYERAKTQTFEKLNELRTKTNG